MARHERDYIIGLDLGIASVGWACVEVAVTEKDGKEHAQPIGLIDCGVRCFAAAEEPKTGESLNFARRAARSQRHTIARRASRMREVRKLLLKHGLLTKNEFQAAYSQNTKDKTFFKKRNRKLLNAVGVHSPAQEVLSGSLNGENGYQANGEKAFFANVWQLRVAALHRKLERAEFAAVICHLIKHRGYLSTRKSERKDADGTLLSGLDSSDAYLGKEPKNLPFNQMDEFVIVENNQRRDFTESEKSTLMQEKKDKKEHIETHKAKSLLSISESVQILRKKSYQTPAEVAVYTFRNYKGQPQYRNKQVPKKDKDGNIKYDKDGNMEKEGSYLHTFNRLDLENELQLIFDKQKAFGNQYANNDLCGQLKHILHYQKPALQGDALKKMWGKCSVYENEDRAPKHSYTGERFVWISKLNNLKINNKPLTDEQRNAIKELPFEQAELKFTQVRKKLGLPENVTFNLCRYLHKNDMEKLIDAAFKALYQGAKKYPKIKDKFNNKELKDKKDSVLNEIENILLRKKDNQEKILQELLQYQPYFSVDEIKAIANIELPDDKKKIQEAEDAVFFKAEFFHAVRKEYADNGLENEWGCLKDNSAKLDKIGEVLAFYKEDKDRKQHLSGFSEKEIEAILGLNFDKSLNLSLKAIREILPEMEKKDENGNFLTYDKACKKCEEIYGSQYSRSKNKNVQEFLPVIDKKDSDTPNNPVVYRTITQARKIINAIIAQHGKPFRVHIEMTRDLGKSRKARDEITKQQEKNKKEKEVAVERFKKLFPNYVGEPSSSDRLKFRLAGLQHDQCIYCGKGLKFDELKEKIFEKGYLEIDHAIPFSRSWDDSLNNKVLACGKCNQEKGNKTPFEWLGNDIERWRKFEIRVNGCHFSPKKKQHILRQDYDEEKEKPWVHAC